MGLKNHRVVVTPELEDPEVDFEFQNMFDFDMTDKENDEPQPIPDVTSHPSPPVSDLSDEAITIEKTQNSTLESLDEFTIEKEQFAADDSIEKQNSTSDSLDDLTIEKEQFSVDEEMPNSISDLADKTVNVEKEQSAVDDFLKNQKSISDAFDKKNGINRKRIESESDSESERIYKKDMKKLKKKSNAIAMKAKLRRQERHMREIAEQMLSDNFAIPSHLFRKVVHSIMDWKHPNHRIQYNAIEALQRETEMMLTKMLRLGWHMAVHAKRKTLQIEDLRQLKAILDINKEGSTFMP